MEQGERLEHYLHEHIPLSAAMAVSAASVSEEAVLLKAPLAPNINHRETVFGGSASALGILAAWSLLHVRLTAQGLNHRLVIQRNAMEYELPILGEFSARAELAQPEKWDRFIRTLSRRGMARIHVMSTLEFDGKAVGRLHGEFVAM